MVSLVSGRTLAERKGIAAPLALAVDPVAEILDFGGEPIEARLYFFETWLRRFGGVLF